ncbi:hypothetical protein AMJ39_01010 [candidate division TA06 bacterium DG_24]|uniref:NADP-dependent oxidoreductase domain-containing protein n=2 Tax=Bacteria division TA06 TaxID=1156500 RepID=A0A0S8GG30_UNCT6|nr:MAG: hypothetical protein AMJ39_01010 [candidate division TA06 bacterium DG_24]KPK71664.1 MAG: hypothetical protein AMJ82_00155 [candidate division TA06 bacterium SM23_40]
MSATLAADSERLLLPRLMVGSNPFQGVSYKSEALRREYRSRFSRPEAILEVIGHCLELGVTTAHCYARQAQVEALKMAQARYGGLPDTVAVLPDVYEAMARQTGEMAGTATREKIKFIVRSMPRLVSAGVSGNVLPLVEEVLETEIGLVSQVHPRIILLHGMLADMACAIRHRSVVETFIKKVRATGAVAGLATHNLGVMWRNLTAMELSVPVIMAPFNPLGFMMNPSVDACLDVAGDRGSTLIIAKKVLAGGVIEPEGALRYVFEEVGVESAAIGVATIEEAEKTFGAARSILGDDFDRRYEIAS